MIRGRYMSKRSRSAQVSGLTFTQAFSIGKSQAEVDFIDIPVLKDLPLFVDPFAISQRRDRWSQNAHRTLMTYFQALIDHMRGGRPKEARELLSHLSEPNETHLGFSRGRSQGAGIGAGQAMQLYTALAGSAAFTTGFITSIEECELMIDGIGRDKISDLTTNVIRKHLVEYTQQQCELWNLPMQDTPLGAWFEPDTLLWRDDYVRLPTYKGRPLLLVPKGTARFEQSFDHQRFYRHSVLNFLKAEAMTGTSSLGKALGSLVRARKNGDQFVTKRDLMEQYPLTKKFLYDFSKANPKVLAAYRKQLEKLERQRNSNQAIVDADVDATLAAGLAASLSAIPGGNDDATLYHRVMIGIVEFLFYPMLVHPVKEVEIHDGRKRIDIVMDNNAADGIFWRLSATFKLPCPYIVFECKNYTNEVANAELDQLAGRFSPNRGTVGFLLCRTFKKRQLFVQRCQDTFSDGHGLIIPLDDDAVLRLLALIESGRRRKMDEELSRLVREVMMN
jgi:hypothetical protein